MSIKNMFLDKEDNLELASVMTVVCLLCLIALQIYACMKLGQAFNPSEFGTGAATTLAGGGGAKLMGNKGDYA